MDTNPGRIKEILETVKEITNLIIEIAQLIVKNRILFSIVLGLPILYLLGNELMKYYIIKQPENKVLKFYDQINNHEFEKAWAFINRDLKIEEWDNNIGNFRDGFRTYGKYVSIEIENLDELTNPLSSLYLKERNYTIKLQKKDIVKLKEFKSRNDWHKFRSSLWMQIFYNLPLDKIVDGSLGHTIEYIRFYQIKSKLMKFDGDWQLVELEKIKEGINY